MADVGSISGQIGHICRYGRHQADVGRRSALIDQKIGTLLPYLPIWATSGRRRQNIGTYLPYLPKSDRRRHQIGTNRPEDRYLSAIFADRPYGRHHADVGSISGQIGHICRCGRHQADVSRISALIGQKIGTYLPYLPMWQTPGRRRQNIGTNRAEDRHLSAIFADMADTRPLSAEERLLGQCYGSIS